MWFIGVEVEQETSAPPPKKNPGSAPGGVSLCMTFAEDSELVWRQLASMKLKQPKERELEIGKKKTQCSGVF